MAEALACGTPVIALRNGSVPEVVQHGITVFACETEDEPVDAMGRVSEIDRAQCRAAAEQRFSVTALGNGYEEVYARVCPSVGSTTAFAVQVGGHENR